MTTAAPEADTNLDHHILEELDWQPMCDVGRSLSRKFDGLPPCPNTADFTAVVHRCTSPGRGISVLLCGECCKRYLDTANEVATYPPGSCTCRNCHRPVTPTEVIHNVHPL